jgi:hypothetical protein
MAGVQRSIRRSESGYCRVSTDTRVQLRRAAGLGRMAGSDHSAIADHATGDRASGDEWARDRRGGSPGRRAP